MTDISIRLGELLESTCDPATSEACRDAIMEINFLRAENARLRLTDVEREAVRTAMNAFAEDNANPECAAIEATLSGLLERTK